MSRHRRPRRSTWTYALVLLVGVPAALAIIGLLSWVLTGLILFTQILSDLSHGY
jgi:hypothetical protein